MIDKPRRKRYNKQTMAKQPPDRGSAETLLFAGDVLVRLRLPHGGEPTIETEWHGDERTPEAERERWLEIARTYGEDALDAALENTHRGPMMGDPARQIIEALLRNHRNWRDTSPPYNGRTDGERLVH